jgi:hypothetical protein
MLENEQYMSANVKLLVVFHRDIYSSVYHIKL